jgi:hypothetical protein
MTSWFVDVADVAGRGHIGTQLKPRRECEEPGLNPTRKQTPKAWIKWKEKVGCSFAEDQEEDPKERP